MSEGELADGVVEHLRQQAATCRGLGARFTAALCEAAADDAERGGPVARVLRGQEGEPGPSALALRLVGALGRLVLRGAAPELARAYPADEGDDGAPGPRPGDAARAAALLPGVVAAHEDALRADLGAAPQTNEVGRAAALWGGLLHVLAEGAGRGVAGADDDVPVRLHDVGSSAGLLLQADRMRMTARDGGAWGPPGSPVQLGGAWDVAPWRAAGGGDAPPRAVVVERVGVDVAPLDPGDPRDARRLLSFVWPEQRERVHRLRGALELAAAHPVAVRRGGPATWPGGWRCARAPSPSSGSPWCASTCRPPSAARRRRTWRRSGGAPRRPRRWCSWPSSRGACRASATSGSASRPASTARPPAPGRPRRAPGCGCSARPPRTGSPSGGAFRAESRGACGLSPVGPSGLSPLGPSGPSPVGPSRLSRAAPGGRRWRARVRRGARPAPPRLPG
ncbi:DUF2332 domain-containing protein [uncultured Pseudokineococcus sp.]|uniref:DUF2332 domain-containing protein n=1 Tax=uncultured Pseudokineococcus sp. TaxID=1642928 RepID=UPI002618DA6D|nr:DUF2332 domain-containing protein [uncultured Pseudokineococcus sp.]